MSKEHICLVLCISQVNLPSLSCYNIVDPYATKRIISHLSKSACCSFIIIGIAPTFLPADLDAVERHSVILN
ncbi:hypothetical protein KCU98_g129, partial [Aureobasidium melanogenum]